MYPWFREQKWVGLSLTKNMTVDATKSAMTIHYQLFMLHWNEILFIL